MKNKKVKEVNSWEDLRNKSVQERFVEQQIKPKTKNQALYMKNIETSTISFCIGPPGSGKTFLPCALAIKALKKGEVQQIIITRPAVECGRVFGFLPGGMREKFDPYLGPIYQAFAHFLSKQEIEKLIAEEKILIIPLAFMRGLTFKNSYVILDEANNCSYIELKMVLTRLGENSKLVISGDIRQSDLTPNRNPPLVQVMRKLKGHKDISHTQLTNSDVVRHPLITWIEDQLYEEFEEDDWNQPIRNNFNNYGK